MKRSFAMLALLTLAATAHTGESKPEDVAAYRHQAMEALGKHMKATSMIVKGQAPFVGDTLGHALALNEAGKGMLAWFPEGTGPDKVKSDSKAEVWSKRADFEKAVTDYTAATEKLVEAARTGDLAQIQPAFGAVGKTCGGCHDGFRVPEE